MALPTGVYTLPVELLSRVFVLGAADQVIDSPFLLRPDEHHYVASVTDFQLLISHVCKHWREVALRISSLWTSLHFRELGHIARAQAFLARAAVNHPLDILVDTVSVDDHIPGVTLCRDEMRSIFALITPHVARWRAFYLKVRTNECKLVAREALSTCGPAPRLETLQLYHFEDYRTTQNLYIATYRPPVQIFDNVLPALKNVSLIGVNLPWAHAPYLQQLHALELALHPDNIRPPFTAWDAMLHEHSTRICVPALEELSLTDLDPDHLSRLLHTLELPRLTTLALDLPEQDFAAVPEQDFTGVVEMIAGVSPTTALAPPLTIAALHTLRIIALECAPTALAALLRALVSLSVLELDFGRIRDPEVIFRVLLETIPLPLPTDSEETQTTCNCDESQRTPVLPRLKEARLFGLSGERMRALMAFRRKFAEGCGSGCAVDDTEHESPPSSASSSCSSSSLPGSPEDSTAISGADIISSEVNSNTACCRRLAMPRFVIRWDHRRRGRDTVLEQLVRQGRVECADEEEGDDIEEYDEDSSEYEEDERHGDSDGEGGSADSIAGGSTRQ
ncbi:F-box domain-containing protein [Mycena sanguinolenta]|uniref:F-box domain-containing protein n=1 Tax=Mycena sanguinolenta TaxID=230812 RepID=A0A8H6XUE2_9AGAR|nr:F-box domain-containing protein [Mycena sanguinolenta]